ncbi:hypothetical protein STAQ_17900 [Allostella sp. ATCC 35155]|nr:hypothetical protein STAQ_17900 [Stella sp. ATCC 35155]
MAVRAGNRKLVRKIDRLAKEMELTKIVAVDSAVDRALRPEDRRARGDRLERLSARLAEIPDRPDAYDPMEWDEYGLPR